MDPDRLTFAFLLYPVRSNLTVFLTAFVVTFLEQRNKIFKLSNFIVSTLSLYRDRFVGHGFVFVKRPVGFLVLWRSILLSFVRTLLRWSGASRLFRTRHTDDIRRITCHCEQRPVGRVRKPSQNQRRKPTDTVPCSANHCKLGHYDHRQSTLPTHTRQGLGRTVLWK